MPAYSSCSALTRGVDGLAHVFSRRLQDALGMLLGNGRKLIIEFAQGLAVHEIVKQRGDGDARPSKDRRATHHIGVATNHVALRQRSSPVRCCCAHVSILLYLTNTGDSASPRPLPGW